MPDLRAPVPGFPSKRRLALICDSLEDNFQSALVDAGLAAAAAHDVDLLIIPGGKLGESLGKNFVHDLVPKWVDGIIVAAHTIGHVATERQMKAFLDLLHHVPTVALGEVPGAECCLSIDNERAAYELTQHLVMQHRFQRFAYISGPVGNAEGLSRETGFARALREADITVPAERQLVGHFTWEGGRQAICELLDQRGVELSEVEVLACANDAMAVGACLELQRRGYCIPRDIAVVGFDDTELARHLPAPLSTVRQPLRDLLLDAVEILLRALATGNRPRGSHRYGAEVVLRRSCGCPRLPNLPRPSGHDTNAPAPRSARTISVPLREDLDDGFVAALDQVESDWLVTLLEALFRQLEGPGTAFYDALEILCFGLLRTRRTTGAWQHTLLAVRRHVARGGITRDQQADLDRLIDGAMRLTGELTTSFLARQREELLENLRILSDATAGLLSAPDLGTIASVARSSFPELGVERGMICLFTSDFGPEVSMAPLSVFGLGDGKAPVLSASRLAPDELLRGRSWVVEPLGSGTRPLGLAVLQCGLAHVSWYERLRDALTAAINGAQLIQQVQSLVDTDPLTGLNNRRYLTQAIRDELHGEQGARLPLSLFVLDLDGFKSLNDDKGHDAGDRALIEAASSIHRCLRDTDTLARFGGDEFVAVLPSTTAEQAKAVAERVLRRLPLALEASVSAALTCSIGIATIERGERTGDAELFRLADQALLYAKRDGKNRAAHARELAKVR